MPSSTTADDALGRLDPEERLWVERFRDELRERLGPRLRDVRIFGSKVRGDYHDESDIDLLVLVQSLDFETWTAIVDLASSVSSWLSPVTRDFDAYHSSRSRATGFYEEMRHGSVRL